MKKESNGTTIVKNFMKSQGSVFIILLVMCIIASIFTDKFLSVSNLSNVVTQSVTCGIAAIGMTFVILAAHTALSCSFFLQAVPACVWYQVQDAVS